MKKILLITLTILLSLNAQALFEIKDASNNSVFEISNDGLRVFNLGDTLMVISSSEIKANIGTSKDKALSRSFSVTTSTTGKAGLANILEVTTDNTIMREGVLGEEYTNFSPDNLFLGLNAGVNIDQGLYNIFIGNDAGLTTTIDDDPIGFQMAAYNIFMGFSAGKMATYSFNNTYIGMYSGYGNTDGMNNVFLGMETGSGNTGSQNTFIGSKVCANGYSGGGSYNTFVGYEAGLEIQGGHYNTFLGRQAGKSNVSGARNIFIGNQSGYSETGSDKLYIDNSNTATPLIYGDFSTDYLGIHGLLRVNSNNLALSVSPGGGVDPINYIYQGVAGSSNTKDYAVAIYDPLWVSGSVWAISYNTTSDKRFKKNIVPIRDTISKISQIDGVYFEWND
ncbi:MAG: tail fiber domain-containing protein, partial [Candidatus Delongbacteria bacterium]|nr:tail fiber domain-containing protein [Candidatus Delongbacteria bacterium]